MVYVVSFQNEIVAIFRCWSNLVEQIDKYDFDKIELIELN